MSAIAITLRWSRIIVAAVIWAATTASLVSYGSTLPQVGELIGRIQFIPAAMAFSISIIVGWLLVTLVCGRVYCSTVCPLGVYQDICARIPRLGHRVPSSRQYHYSEPLTACRTITLAIVVAAILLAISVLISLADPWRVYTRACTSIGYPLCKTVLHLFSTPPVIVGAASAISVIVASVTMTIVSYLAWKGGRTVCNSVCPVGTALGYVSNYSILHFDINTDLCTQCRRCEHVCKASCIDLTSHVVDGSRCVTCFDCIDACPHDAITYTWRRHQLSMPMMQKIGPFATGAQLQSPPTTHLDAVKQMHRHRSPSAEKDL